MTFMSNMIQANGITLHYSRSGGDKPPLVMLHGFTDDGACWFPLAEPLTQEYDVILPDARGHGKSARIADIGFSRELMAEDAAALIQALGLNRPAVMGHSMGGIVSLILAATHPDLVSCLLLEDPVLLPTPTPEEDIAGRAGMREWAKNLLNLQALSREDLIAGEHQRSPLWSDAELQPWADSKYRVDTDVFEDHSMRQEWRPLMQRVQCPVLLIYGDNHTIVNDATAQEAATLWKTGQAVQISGAGHCIHRDNFADSLQLVQTFLRENYAG